MLDFMTNILNTYQRLSPEHKGQQGPKKDAALKCIGVLHESLLASKKYSNKLEPMMKQHVFPEFDSPLPYLRMREAWMCKIYSGASYQPESQWILVDEADVLVERSDAARSNSGSVRSSVVVVVGGCVHHSIPGSQFWK